MSVAIQIRSVPDELHRQAKARAALEGLSLSEFLLRELRKALEKPSRAEMLRRLSTYPEIELPQSAAALLREERESR